MQRVENSGSLSTAGSCRFRQIAYDRREEFLQKGCKQRHFFPHQILYLPKCGPDGFKIASWMCGNVAVNQLWEIVLYADYPTVDEFPTDIYFDDELTWHQQQFGRTGQIATANLVVDGNCLYSMVHISDLVQRIGRRREFKTRIENRFRGWPQMLLNAILNFAIERDVATIYSPRSGWARKHTDPKRDVQNELFERVYDRALNRQYLARPDGNWWAWSVAENRERVVLPAAGKEPLGSEKTICVCHDVERGIGHLESDPAFAASAENSSRTDLWKIVEIEEKLGVRATYNILGCFLDEVRSGIEQARHCLAFHSYDHKLTTEQLAGCRKVDYRIKGYRPPQSKITAELTHQNLCFHNFEWLASSELSLGIDAPVMESRLIKIPVHFDDFDLYRGSLSYPAWRQRAIETIRKNNLTVFCLHDCYAGFWLPDYSQFLGELSSLGTFKTLDQVSGRVILSNAA